MVKRLYADSLRCAIYEEAPGGGNPDDPNSLMNRPVISPLSWLPNIYFHSNLDYYGVVASTLGTTITHGAIAGGSRAAGGGTGEASAAVSFEGYPSATDDFLLQHNLGYVPNFYGIVNGNLMPNGTIIQYQPGVGSRFTSMYATTSQIRVYTFGYSSANTLPAISVTYGAMVFRNVAPIPSELMLDLQPGRVVFGQGKFISSNPHLRVVGSGDSQFAVATDRTAGIRNGGVRAWLPTGGARDWGAYNGGIPAPSFVYVTSGI